MADNVRSEISSYFTRPSLEDLRTGTLTKPYGVSFLTIIRTIDKKSKPFEIPLTEEWYADSSRPPFEIDFDQTIELDFDQVDSLEDNIYGIIARAMSQVEEVDKVLAIREGNLLCIWTVPTQCPRMECPRSVRKAIYDKELHVMDILQGFDFDFNLAEHEEVKELQDSGLKVIYEK